MTYYTRLIALFLLLLTIKTANSQNLSVKFGDIPRTDLEMVVYKPDPGADAVILSDCGSAELVYIGSRFQIALVRDIRIKIINKNGFDYANIEIPYYASEKLQNVEASTFNLVNGNVVEVKIPKKSFIVDKVNKYYHVMRIAFPNVYEGSVIEYRYKYISNSIYQFMPWDFQSEIPVKHSEYTAIYPDYFNYRTLMKGNPTKVIRKTGSQNVTFGGYGAVANIYQWELNDISAFKEEPFISSTKDQLIKLDFELIGLNFPGQSYEELTPNYLTLSKKLLEREDFGIALSNTKFLEKQTKKIILNEKNDLAKLKKIHQFVSKKILWDGDNDYSASNPLRKVYNDERGNSAEINMILIAMLRQAGLTADPVILSTRSNGSLHPIYAMLQQFDYIIAQVYINGKIYLVDATEPLMPANILPFKCLNDKGRLIHPTNFDWVKLSNSEKNTTTSLVNVQLNENGHIEGNINNAYSQYDAFSLRKFIKLESIEGYKDYLKSSNANWNIKNFQINNLDSLYNNLIETYNVSIDNGAEATSVGFIINPYILGSQNENPFKNDERKYPIDFGSPSIKTYILNLTIPDGYTVDEKPNNISLKLPENGGSFLFSCDHRDNLITIQSKLTIDQVRFKPEDYMTLREFYARIMQKQSELIVLKKKV